jgi:hypothetical protein
MYCMTSRSRKKKPDRPDHALLLSQLQQVALGLGETFAPFCEVVLHDLRDADHSIVALHNNLSGREVGDATTELGLARIADERYPQVLTNYANTLPDGRQAKSTSIGIKDADGKYVAALCMNIDLTLFGACRACCASSAASMARCAWPRRWSRPVPTPCAVASMILRRACRPRRAASRPRTAAS